MLSNHTDHDNQSRGNDDSPDGILAPKTPPPRRRSFVGLIISLLLIAAIPACFVIFAEHKETSKAVGKKLPVIVTSAYCKRQDVPLAIYAVGNVESMESIAVRARVDGELMEVFFREGEDVRKGALLFKLDQRPLIEAVQQADANVSQCHSDVLQQEAMVNKSVADLRRLQASMESTLSRERLAKRQWDRYSDLVKQGAVSLEQEDQMRTNFESMSATLRADKAAIDNQKAVIESDRSKLLSLKSKEHSARSSLQQSKLQLNYCSITSPVDGRTGSLLVHRGNMVKANDQQPLVVINKLRPIYVTFALPEAELAQVKQYQMEGPLTVDVLPVGATESNAGFGAHAGAGTATNMSFAHVPHRISGKLTFIDNAVQMTTGTIKLKGTFENADGLLWPGQFVNVSLNLATIKNVPTVPSQAVQVGQQGQYVFVIKADNSVEVRPVKVERTVGHISVIASGLTGNEHVVTDGQVQLTPSSFVSINNERK